MIPPLDAHLANRMEFRGDLKRLPITELGCAGGAAALARATDYLRAYPTHRVLVLTAELTSATFQLKDHSKGNLVASMLFGDGIAAAVMGGKPGPKGGPSVRSSSSAWFPDTLGLMGFDLKASGFHLILSPRIPAVVKREVQPFLARMLQGEQLTREDLSFFVLHPGGTRVLEALEETLSIPRADVQHCWDTLANYGNLSSSMVMFILDELWRTKTPKPGSLGVLAAFGPAFGAEASLLGWEAAA
jgi:alkylresorcinol/alkylpyrone synthase